MLVLFICACLPAYTSVFNLNRPLNNPSSSFFPSSLQVLCIILNHLFRFSFFFFLLSLYSMPSFVIFLILPLLLTSTVYHLFLFLFPTTTTYFSVCMSSFVFFQRRGVPSGTQQPGDLSLSHHRLAQAAEPAAGEGGGRSGVRALSDHSPLGRDVAGSAHAEAGRGPQVSQRLFRIGRHISPAAELGIFYGSVFGGARNNF